MQQESKLGAVDLIHTPLYPALMNPAFEKETAAVVGRELLTIPICEKPVEAERGPLRIG